MRTIRINLFVFLLFCVSLLFAQSEVQDAGSSRNLLIDNPVWSSYFGIGPNDSIDIELPIIYDFEFVLEDLIGVETNKLDYLLKANGKVRLIDFEGKELLSKVSNSDISIDFKLLFKNRIL